jgi:uncharacterized protein (TIGR02246 family)
MKKFLLFITAATFVSFVATGQNSQDKEAVKKVILAFQEDFNNGNFKHAVEYTTSDWEHINPLGGIDKGRDEILTTVRSVHQTFLKGVSMTIDTMSIRFITPEVAIADVIHKVSTFITPDGVKHENERHIKTYVVVKQKGKWRLTHDHNTIIQGLNAASNQN